MDKHTALPKPQLHIDQLSSGLNAMDIYKALGLGDDCILLDSSKADSSYSNYSIIGVKPFLKVLYSNGKLDVTCLSQVNWDYEQLNPLDKEDIFSYINRMTRYFTIENTTNLPFIGGCIGYLGYDLSKDLENIPASTRKTVTLPDSYFVFYDSSIVIDHKTNTLHAISLGLTCDNHLETKRIIDTLTTYSGITEEADSTTTLSSPTCKTVSKARAETPSGTSCNTTEPSINESKLTSPFTKPTYMQAVKDMCQYIEDGHIYIANMTHTFSGPYTKNPLDTYQHLRRINPAPFSAYMPLNGFHILSSSPERFMEIRNGLAKTRPIKGTIPRGANQQEDLINKKRLAASEKDKSELLMIVDLERNDLSKVCVPGSVKVNELFAIEEYATVFHLVSTIEGTLQSDYTSVDCIKASFPGGSITGAPKIRAMEIIEELEPTARNIYTGSIGYFGFDGDADFNIVIRTILLKDQKAYIGVGGGITYESDPGGEYQETLDKAYALFKTLNAL